MFLLYWLRTDLFCTMKHIFKNMKKLVLIAFTLFTGILQLNGQDGTFSKGTSNIGVGFGLGGAYGLNSFSTTTPAFGAHFDHGIVDLDGGGTIGVGGYVGYKGFVYKIDKYRQKWNYFMVGARGTFHYDVFEVEELDTYAGIMLAYYVLNYSDDIPNNVLVNTNYSSSAYASVFAGAKYYFTPEVAAFGEVGYGVSWLTLGAAFKF